MLRGALIGFGQVAECAHEPALRNHPSFSIVAVADPDVGRRARAQQLLTCVRAYSSLEELLEREPELDFVDIATPPHLHATQAMQALRAGCHVLCEKPLVLETRELAALRAAADAADRAVFPVHNWKHAAPLRKLHELIEAGAIGPVRHVEWHVLRSRPSPTAGDDNWRTDPRRAGGGILIDHGWHVLYLLSWLLGRPPQHASAALKYPAGAGPQGEEEADCLLLFGATTAAIHLTWRATSRALRVVMHGERGTITLADETVRLETSTGSPAICTLAGALAGGGLAHPEWLQSTLDDFALAMADPGARAAALMEAGICVRMLDRLRRAATPRAEPVMAVVNLGEEDE